MARKQAEITARTLLTRDEVRRLFRVNETTVDSWRRRGWLADAGALPSAPPLRPRPQALLQVRDAELRRRLRQRLQQNDRPLAVAALPHQARHDILRRTVTSPSGTSRLGGGKVTRLRGPARTSRRSPSRTGDRRSGSARAVAPNLAGLRHTVPPPTLSGLTVEQLAEMADAARTQASGGPRRKRTAHSPRTLPRPPRTPRATTTAHHGTRMGDAPMLDDAELESLMAGLPLTPSDVPMAGFPEDDEPDVAPAAPTAPLAGSQADATAVNPYRPWPAAGGTSASETEHEATVGVALEVAPLAGLSPQGAVLAALDPQNDLAMFAMTAPFAEPAIAEASPEAAAADSAPMPDWMSAAAPALVPPAALEAAVPAPTPAATMATAELAASEPAPPAARDAVAAASAAADVELVVDHLHRLESELKRVERSLADLASRPAAAVELQPMLQKIKLEVEMGNAKRDILAGSLTRISDDMKEMRQHLAAASRAAVDYVWDLQRRLDQQVEPAPARTRLSFVREHGTLIAALGVLLATWALILWLKTGDLRLALGGLVVANAIGCGVILTVRSKSTAETVAAEADGVDADGRESA